MDQKLRSLSCVRVPLQVTMSKLRAGRFKVRAQEPHGAALRTWPRHQWTQR
jgi:hypothetical protein